jgi:membrane protein DedA with SNARE-associated domain
MEIDRTYIAAALLWAVIGMLLGLYMGIAADNTLRTMHVAVMVVGFVTLAIYGIIYRLWPTLQRQTLARAQFWIAQVGAAGIIIGSYFYATSSSVPLVATASIVFLVGAALMAWLYIKDMTA